MTTINAVTSSSIRHAEFVRLTTPSNVYTFSNAPSAMTVSGITFSNLGSLLMVGDVQRDIKSTSDDMTISLAGINPANLVIVLAADIKGSTLEIWRGFLDSDNQIITSPSLQFFKRYQGLVNSVSIAEDFDSEKRIRTAVCTLSCSSLRRILENRISGVKTNKDSWQKFYSGDTSMDRVSQISNTFFDFGAPPSQNTQSSEVTNDRTKTWQQNFNAQ